MLDIINLEVITRIFCVLGLCAGDDRLDGGPRGRKVGLYETPHRHQRCRPDSSRPYCPHVGRTALSDMERCPVPYSPHCTEGMAQEYSIWIETAISVFKMYLIFAVNIAYIVKY